MRHRLPLIEEALPEVLMRQLQTLAQLQHGAESLQIELAALKQIITREVLPAEPFRSLAMELRGHESILIVDDNEITRAIAQEILEGFGYHLLDARGSPIDGSRHEPVDLMLLDVPLLNADQLKRVQQAKQCAATARLVVCTLLPEGAAREELRACGVDGFVSKPFHPLTLARCIRQTLDIGTKY